MAQIDCTRLDRSMRSEIAVNEKSDERIKVIFEQPQFVRTSSTHFDVGIYESVCIYCEERSFMP